MTSSLRYPSLRPLPSMSSMMARASSLFGPASVLARLQASVRVMTVVLQMC
jgi:hypothetical protein